MFWRAFTNIFWCLIWITSWLIIHYCSKYDVHLIDQFKVHSSLIKYFISGLNHCALSFHTSSLFTLSALQYIQFKDSNLWTECRACHFQCDWDSLFTLQLRDRVMAHISVSARCSKLLLIKPLARHH